MLKLKLLMAVLVASCGLSLQAQESKPNPKLAFLDGKEAGADFVTQGEYSVPDRSSGPGFGLQVIAEGSGKFKAVLFPGGLPGAGWNEKDKIKLAGETKDDVTTLTGGGYSVEIKGETASLTGAETKGTLKKTVRESPTLGLKPDARAKILFDGSNVDAWNPGKMMEGNLMGVGTRTKEVFADYTLHLEFRTPFMPNARGQGRGNSGMYLGDQYECQVLDSFGLDGADNECGGIYQNSKPRINMCYPPLSWQTYDVEFTAAKFDDQGNITAPGKTTIKHNGVLIHENLELKPTPGGGRKDSKPGALYLQDHGDPVRFRNIWVVQKN